MAQGDRRASRHRIERMLNRPIPECVGRRTRPGRRISSQYRLPIAGDVLQVELHQPLTLILWYKEEYDPKDTLQLLGRWMRPGSFSLILCTDDDATI